MLLGGPGGNPPEDPQEVPLGMYPGRYPGVLVKTTMSPKPQCPVGLSGELRGISVPCRRFAVGYPAVPPLAARVQVLVF